MNDSELIDRIDAWAFAEGEAEFTDAASWDYRRGFRDACDVVRGLIQGNRETQEPPADTFVVNKLPLEHHCTLPAVSAFPAGTQFVCTERVDSLSDATCGIRWVASSSFFTRRPKWREFDWAW